MRQLNATVLENIQLAIKAIDDNYTHDKHSEYRTLIELRYYWISLTSNFRMYLLNQLNAFQKENRGDYLYLIKELHVSILERLQTLKSLHKKDKLEFTTIIAFEKIYPAVFTWKEQFNHVKKVNDSEFWRSDTVIYQKELKPKFEKINSLLHILDLRIEDFSKKDITTLHQMAQLQVNSIWTATLVGLIVLLAGFLFLERLILNPIENVTQALKDQSKGIPTTSHPNISILETKNLVSAFKEMRKQIHARQEELEYHALHDNLTGLANRKLFIERLDQAIHNSQQERTSFAILIMDLDRFKEVNDTLGHAVGDKLLQKVAKRLVNILREVDVIVRLGGDEFAVLLSTANEEHAEKIANKIIHEFQNVFTVMILHFISV